MKFIDYLRTAFKNFFRQKIRTFLTVTAITVGSLSLILMASLLLSLRNAAIDSLKKIGAFNIVTVTRDPNSANSSDNPQLISAESGSLGQEDGKKIDDSTLAAVKKIPGVVDATPTLSVWVKTIRLDGQDKKMWSNILAYDPQTRVFDMPLLAGRNLVGSDMDKIVVGAKFLDTYGLRSEPQAVIGKKVILAYETGPESSPDWGELPAKPEIQSDGSWKGGGDTKVISILAEIVGVADNRQMDDSQNYINIAWGKKLMTNVSWRYDESGRKECEMRYQETQERKKQAEKNQEALSLENSGYEITDCSRFGKFTLLKEDNFARSGYGSIILKAKSDSEIEVVAKEAEKLGYGAVTAQNMLNQINLIVRNISIVLAIIGGISLFVAAIGIINTMLMAGYERIREIGVMRACGATKFNIRLLFTLEAAFLGFWGGMFGVAISIFLLKGAGVAVKKFGADLGNLPVERVGDISVLLIVTVIAFTTFIGLVSGLYPAIRAARLDPVEALRYE